SVTVLRHVSFIPAGGLAFKNGVASGVAAFLARRIFQGPPLNGPISSALLPVGPLILGTTIDPAGSNLLVEITRGGRLVASKNVDTGAAGALFGMVATGSGDDNAQLYFNDDNDNTVKVLTIDN
ncbi:MAG: SMP-30/Gluconolaconase/LRE-like region, partial [Candidatus Eremiobacteraeota bacterium]|nr:SMP-30/Gluconolaconase/LRE-like region [Candidatus Eremiobacteraeota bacterium]